MILLKNGCCTTFQEFTMLGAPITMILVGGRSCARAAPEISNVAPSAMRNRHV